MKSRSVILLIAFLGLAAAVALSVHEQVATHHPALDHPLAAFPPEPPAGWSVHNTPLGQTELATGETLRTLGLSDYFYRTYTQGSMEVRVYVAYWAPGKMDPALVWLHQPDNCWVANGGVIRDRDDARVLPSCSPAVSVWPALFRVFQFSDAREEVVFWDSVGGQPSGFNWNDASFVVSRWKRFIHSIKLGFFGIQPRDQLVVRISTNQSITEVTRSDLWPSLFKLLTQSRMISKSL